MEGFISAGLLIVFLYFCLVRTSAENTKIGKKISYNKNYREAWRIYEEIENGFLRNISESYKQNLEETVIHSAYRVNPKKYDYVNIRHTVLHTIIECLNLSVKREYDENNRKLSVHGFFCLEALINILWAGEYNTNLTKEEANKLADSILCELCIKEPIYSYAPDPLDRELLGETANKEHLTAWKVFLGSATSCSPYRKLFYNKKSDVPSQELIRTYINKLHPEYAITIKDVSVLESIIDKKTDDILRFLDEIRANKKAKHPASSPFITY